MFSGWMEFPQQPKPPPEPEQQGTEEWPLPEDKVQAYRTELLMGWGFDPPYADLLSAHKVELHTIQRYLNAGLTPDKIVDEVF